jgi:hypothetical protein
MTNLSKALDYREAIVHSKEKMFKKGSVFRKVILMVRDLSVCL